ncbi:FAD/NAD(P)-binding domain-containing protein [Bimuria novae-zelandiae CBS 107.79]|uniref:FAD/NAD(P)-binding domain-containing protein n=1 Tax=Bimuria novae-zelandiae CBS 107.79 TaxID=1447943 RepID=A0A6A5VPB1_9PLEO|nr:FAD/NAD(P)-binding domain-containing protein [Bimuria novae-zelandiae CBS 107.79]
MLPRASATCRRAASAAGRSITNPHSLRTHASVAPVAPPYLYKVVVVGGGTAGMTVSHQLLRTGKFTQDEIAIVDPAEWHHYQPGWTLVGGGLKKKEDLRQPLRKLVGPKLRLFHEQVGSFSPEENQVTLSNGDRLIYEQLVVAPGINVDTSTIKGLPEALADPKSPVSTIFKYETCDKAWRNIQDFKKGTAIFAHPAGAIKCAGAPQKIMWLASDHWQRADLYNYKDPSSSPINISFATGLPVMFGVPKYNATLEELRKERGIEGLFQHDLVEINGDTAVFATPSGERHTKKFDFLHAVPKMGPYTFVKNSALADAAGYVDVDQATLQHKKYPNVWSAGDASSLPTSKTAAAVTAQAPVLVSNMLRSMEGKEVEADYDGYTSCPLLTEYGKVLLAEFKYGGQPKETFGKMFGVDQATPRKAFYYLKKDFFPWVYQNHMVKGRWGGPKGFIR